MILNDVKSVRCRTIHMKTGEISYLVEPEESDADLIELTNIICYVSTLANAKKIDNLIFFRLGIKQFIELYPLFKTLSFQYYKKKRKLGVLLNAESHIKINELEITEVSKSVKSLSVFKLQVMLSSPLVEDLPSILEIHHDYFLLNLDAGNVESEHIYEALKKENVIFLSSRFTESHLNLTIDGTVSITD